MLVLAIETSTPQTSVALGSQQGVMGATRLAWARGHAEVVTPSIQYLLEQSEVDIRQVSGVAVGLGPGLFTGLRVGIATARALAQVLQAPMVGMASLDVLAYAARYSRSRICAATDGRRGEVFSAFYRPVPGGVTRETEFTAGPAERLVAELEASAEETLLVGDGALLYRRTLEEAGTPLEFGSAAIAFPDAVSLLELALSRFLREESTRPAAIVPLYVRKSDAEIDWARTARTA
jgi:tRNA threonylcarbamoyladenosine biosynthesis protein TsaB